MDRKIKLQLATNNSKIPTSEIEQDIADTEAEIVQMEKEADFLAATPMGMRDTRLNHMRADAKRSGIGERKRFIERLKGILEIRNEK